jgi:hypothetical protein
MCAAGVYVTLWESYGFKWADFDVIARHANFHSCHIKTKRIQSNNLTPLRLPVSDEQSVCTFCTHLLKLT